MLSIKIVGRVIMLAMPPLMRPGQSSDEVVFAESPLPGVTAIPIVIFNHPVALHDRRNFALWKEHIEDTGNAFLMDVTDAGSTNPFPSLRRVEFTLGTYRMPN